jgi:hypothetical protein
MQRPEGQYWGRWQRGVASCDCSVYSAERGGSSLGVIRADEDTALDSTKNVGAHSWVGWNFLVS